MKHSSVANASTAMRFDSYEQAVVTVTRWIETYNTIRPHSTIGMLAPINYEKQLLGVS